MFLYWLFRRASDTAERSGQWDYNDVNALYNVAVRTIEFIGGYYDVWKVKVLFHYYSRATVCAIQKGEKRKAQQMSVKTLEFGSQLDVSLRLPIVLWLLVHDKCKDADRLAWATQNNLQERAAAVHMVGVYQHQWPLQKSESPD